MILSIKISAKIVIVNIGVGCPADGNPAAIAAQINVIDQNVTGVQIISHSIQLFRSGDLVRVFRCASTTLKCNAAQIVLLVQRECGNPPLNQRLCNVRLCKCAEWQQLAQHRQCQHCCQQPHKFFHTRSSFFVSERSHQPLCFILRPHAAFPQPLLWQISSHRKNSFTLTEFSVFFVQIRHTSSAIFVFVHRCPLSLWKNDANPSVSAFFVHNFVVLYFQMVVFS